MSNLYKRTADLLRIIAIKELSLLSHEKEIMIATASFLNLIAEKSKIQDVIEQELLDKDAMERARANTN